ncbi:MAG: NAD(P)H-dependent oxidoreductase subunit E [Clostridia bacterium]|nr:NAD(P)H-dependent oxidoreductase subunit E [Clostridia bacterium]
MIKNESGRRFDRVCRILDTHKRNPAHLVPILQEVQAEYKYLPEEIMTFIATSLAISPAKVFGVATFYSHFTLEPKGRHIVRICDGTACHVKKSTDIQDALLKKLGLTRDKKTTDDGMFTLELVSCLGACGLAPAIVVDDEVHGPMTPQGAVAIIDAILRSENEKKAEA